MSRYVIDRIRDKSYLDEETGCWIFTGSSNNRNRGQIYTNYNGVHKPMFVPVVSYIEHLGLVPEGMRVLHSCDNPPCWNPEHLFLGTQFDNMQDKVTKNRQLKGEDIPSAKLTENQVLKIRRLHSTGNYNYIELGAIFDVHRVTVSMIVRNLTWKHVST